MSEIHVDSLKNKAGTGAPDFPEGATVTGVVTATTFKGALTGNVTGNTSGTAGGLTGTPSITVQDVTAEYVSIGGTLTYDDVVNVDSVGIVTAGRGLRVNTGGIDIIGITTGLSVSGVATFVGLTTYADGLIVTSGLTTAGAGLTVTGDAKFSATTGTGTTIGLGGINVSGIVTVSQGTVLNGYKVEEGSYDSTALNGEFDFEFENGHIQTHTGSTAGTYFPDFRVSSAQSLVSVMAVGDVVSATLIVAASNTAHYCTTGIKIDNSTSNLTIEWIGSAAASAGKGAGYDIYAFTIQKTAATPAYLIIVNALDAG